jgi:hypothetical protein
MGAILGIKDPSSSEKCLVCHGSVVQTTRGAEPTYSALEGVGCEACHGPAEKYLTEHYLPEWLARSPQAKEADGLRNTKDLAVRAQTCTPCHVGAPGQEVDHDLIAAGHPMLRFNFASYLAGYTGRHWSVAKDKQGRPGFESTALETGKIEAERAALKLLAHRAEHGVSGDRPWPEFSEYDCHSCHAGWLDPSWRPQTRPRDRKPGQVRWGSWYFGRDGDLPAAAQIDSLRRAAERPTPTGVKEAAELALSALPSAAASPVSLDECRKQLLALTDAKSAAGDSWEGARQRYLSIVAYVEAMRDLTASAKGTASWRQDAVLSSLKAMDAATVDWRKFRPDVFRQKLAELRAALGL